MSLTDQFLKLRNRLRTRSNKFNIKGKNNQFHWPDSVRVKCQFTVFGDNNVIQFGAGVVAKEMNITISGSDNTLVIDDGAYLGNGSRLVIEDSRSTIKIGKNSTLGGALVAVTESGSTIQIGSGCMIAHDVEIRCGDSHSIIDQSSGKRINYAKDVDIKDRVWIGAHAKVLKGVTIHSDSVIGLSSVVTKSVDAGCIAVGNPAAIVKRGITWCRERIYDTERFC